MEKHRAKKELVPALGKPQLWERLPCRVKGMGGLGRVILESREGCRGGKARRFAV